MCRTPVRNSPCCSDTSTSVRHCFYNGLASILASPSALGRANGWRAACPPHVSWTSKSRPSYWADKIRAACVEAPPEFRRQRRRLSSPKVSSAPPSCEAGIDVKNETRAPMLVIRNLRCRGALPRRPRAAPLSAPHCTVGAHEKNARECNSRGRVARRSG